MTLNEDSLRFKTVCWTKEAFWRRHFGRLKMCWAFNTIWGYFSDWMSDQLTVKVMVIDVCPDVSWCVCGGSRWRSVWTWSNRCRTAPTRSWRPACRVSRGPTWRRDPSSRRPWVSASITRLTPRRSWSAYESHLLISFLSLSLSLPPEKTPAHDPGSVHGGGCRGAGGRLSTGVSHL